MNHDREFEIAALLLVRGADPNRTERDLGGSLAEYYRAEPVAQFLHA